MGILKAVKAADITISKLSQDNYKVWQELMTEALERRGVWEYVEGTADEPSSDDYKKIWRQNNAVATGLIKGAPTEAQRMRNAKEVWDTLTRIHQSDDRA